MQLYLAVELRCDLNHPQLDTPERDSKHIFLEMENNEAEQYLRQSVVRTDYLAYGGCVHGTSGSQNELYQRNDTIIYCFLRSDTFKGNANVALMGIFQ